jgi:hypothetical protein
MTYEDADLNLLEDMEIAAVARERIAAGGATSMDDLFRRYGIDIDNVEVGDINDPLNDPRPIQHR